MIRVFDTGFDEQGNSVVSIQAEGPLLSSDMQTAPAGGYEVAMVSTGKTSQAVADVLADIKTRIADGSTTPVLASHLDSLGLRAAVLTWAQNN